MITWPGPPPCLNYPNPNPNPKLLARLVRADHKRTVRRLVNQSQWLRETRLGRFLREEADRFLEAKAVSRLPESRDEQIEPEHIESLARNLGAVMAGYKPSTGYVAKPRRKSFRAARSFAHYLKTHFQKIGSTDFSIAGNQLLSWKKLSMGIVTVLRSASS